MMRQMHLEPGSIGKRVIFAVAAVLIGISPAVASPDPTDLERARRDLSAAREAAAVAAGEYAALLARKSLTENEAEDYRAYLARLEQAVMASCRTVLKLKSALGDSAVEPGCDPARAAPPGTVSFPGETTHEEQVAALDRLLGASMSEFDERLLREMDALKQRQASSPDEPAESGGAGGGRTGGRENGQEGSQPPGEDASQGEQTGSDGGREQGEEQSASRGEGSEPQGGAHGGNQGEQGGATKTGERDAPPDEGDDDIVARQLREAAEKETDPVLREKLWQEYRRYKSGKSTANTAKSGQ